MVRLNPLRHQLASTSPIRLSGLVAAVRGGSAAGRDPRERLAALVRREIGVAEAVLCGSGTEALVLALEAAERVRGARTTVVLPAYSCFDVAAAAVRFGRPVTFYDVDPHTLGPDPKSLTAAIDGADRTVVIASLYGMPIDWSALDPLLTGSDALVVEDAAQGHGARWQGTPLGGHGRLGVLSFGRGKGWTGGAGGALLIRDESDRSVAGVTTLAASAGTASVVLKAAAQWSLGRPSLYGLPRAVPGLGLGETTYHDVIRPRAMSPAAASIALDGKATADEWAEARREAAAGYARQLDEIGVGGVIDPPAGSQPGFTRFPVLLPQGLESFTDTGVALRLGAAPGYPRPLPELPPVQSLMGPEVERSFPGARALVDRIVTLPTHPLTRAVERRKLVDLLRRST